jgi:hypothetical protein
MLPCIFIISFLIHAYHHMQTTTAQKRVQMLRDDALTLLATSKLHKSRIFWQAMETAAKSPMKLAEAHLSAPDLDAVLEHEHQKDSPAIHTKTATTPKDVTATINKTPQATSRDVLLPSQLCFDAEEDQLESGSRAADDSFEQANTPTATRAMTPYYAQRRIVDPSATPKEKFAWALKEITEGDSSHGNGGAKRGGRCRRLSPSSPPDQFSPVAPPSGGGVESDARNTGSSSSSSNNNSRENDGVDAFDVRFRDFRAEDQSAARVVTFLRLKYEDQGYSRPMYPPGRMVHLRRVATTKTYCGRYAHTTAFDARWISRDELSCDGGTESALKAQGSLLPYCFSDHLPWHVIEAIDDVLGRIRTNTYSS